MEKFSVEALDLDEGVCLPLAPLVNAGEVFVLFGIRQGDGLSNEVPAEAQVWKNRAERHRL